MGQTEERKNGTNDFIMLFYYAISINPKNIGIYTDTEVSEFLLPFEDNNIYYTCSIQFTYDSNK